MFDQLIKETPDYLIQLGEEEGDRCYVVLNKTYMVEEVKTKLLPQAYEYIEQLQAGLDAKRDMEDEFNPSVEGDNKAVLDFPH